MSLRRSAHTRTRDFDVAWTSPLACGATHSLQSLAICAHSLDHMLLLFIERQIEKFTFNLFEIFYTYSALNIY